MVCQNIKSIYFFRNVSRDNQLIEANSIKQKNHFFENKLTSSNDFSNTEQKSKNDRFYRREESTQVGEDDKDFLKSSKKK